MRYRISLAMAGLAGWSGAAAASEMVDPLGSTYLLKLVVSLFIVVFLMFAVIWLLKRTGRFDGRARHYPLRVLTQMSIGQRERVLLIEVGDRQMLLGVSGGCVESLGWVDPPISPDSLAGGDVAAQLERAGPFARLLKGQLDAGGKRKRSRPAAAADEAETPPRREPAVDDEPLAGDTDPDITLRRPDDPSVR